MCQSCSSFHLRIEGARIPRLAIQRRYADSAHVERAFRSCRMLIPLRATKSFGLAAESPFGMERIRHSACGGIGIRHRAESVFGIERNPCSACGGIGIRFGVEYDRNHAELNRLLDHPRLRVLGLVVPTVDNMLHGHATRRSILLETLRGWVREGYLPDLISHLNSHGFEVLLTADHGNVEGRGIGDPREGSLSEVAGTRVRMYPNETLRRRVAQEFPDARPWPPVGLPEDSHVLLAPPGAVFLPLDTVAISHGGASLDEVVVPFVRLWKE